MNTPTRLSTGFLSPVPYIPRALQIIPSSRPSKESITALKTTMQSLVLDNKHPLALEIVGADEQRSFLVRATTEAALDHAEALLRGQYPQIEVRQLQEHEDPFHLKEHEEVSAVELIETVAKDEAPKLAGEGTDPLLGLLATLGKLPVHTRAILQVGLVPLTTSAFLNNLRAFSKGILGTSTGAGKPESGSKKKGTQSLGSFGLLAFANLVLLGIVYLFRSALVGWIWSALASFLQGDFLNQPAEVQARSIAVAVVLLTIEVLLFVGAETLNRSLSEVPDMRLVYRTRVRLYVIGPKQIDAPRAGQRKPLYTQREQAERRREILLRMVTAYRQFRTTSGTYFITRSLPASEAHLLLRRGGGGVGDGWVRGLLSSSRRLSVEALAALWHLPPPGTLAELEFVDHRRARTLLMPFEVARQSQELATVGYSEHGAGGKQAPFGFLPQFFDYHTLIVGKSGEGKRTFLAHLAREAMLRGGMVLIDPYGELCEQVLQILPPSRAEDVVLIDLADERASVGLNPLDVMLGRGRDQAISDLLKMLARIWVSNWGARMENAFEVSLRTLFEANTVLVAKKGMDGAQRQYTLLDVLPLLTNPAFCKTLLRDIKDDYLHRWWREYYEPLSLSQQRDVINPIITKVAKFERLMARRIVGQSVSTLNIGQMIHERRIILLKLSRGVVGSDVAALIGATVLGLIQMTLEERGQQRENALPPFPVILNEFQMLASADYRTLVELQRYGVTFFLATQSLEYVHKLNAVLLPTVMASVKQLVAFHMSAQDAELVRKEIEVGQEDILHLDMQTCYISLMAANQRQPTFSVKVVPLPLADEILVESIRARCRSRYTCRIADVDEMLRASMQRSMRPVPLSDGESPQQKASSPTTVLPAEKPQARIVSPPLEQERSREVIPEPEPVEERYREVIPEPEYVEESPGEETGRPERSAEERLTRKLSPEEREEQARLMSEVVGDTNTTLDSDVTDESESYPGWLEEFEQMERSADEMDDEERENAFFEDGYDEEAENISVEDNYDEERFYRRRRKRNPLLDEM